MSSHSQRFYPCFVGHVVSSKWTVYVNTLRAWQHVTRCIARIINLSLHTNRALETCQYKYPMHFFLSRTLHGVDTITSVKLTETKVGPCQIEWDLCQIERDQAGILSNWKSLVSFNLTEPYLGLCQFDMGLVWFLLIRQNSSLVSFYLTGAYLCLCQSGFRLIMVVCLPSTSEFNFSNISVGVIDTSVDYSSLRSICFRIWIVHGPAVGFGVSFQ